MEEFVSESDSEYTSYWRDWVCEKTLFFGFSFLFFVFVVWLLLVLWRELLYGCMVSWSYVVFWFALHDELVKF
jgi:hypothetical protein